MNSGIKTLFLACLFIMLAMFGAVNIMSNERNAMYEAMKYLMIASVLICLIKPKAGIYLVLIQTATLDLLKRFLIVYGSVWYQDLYIVLGIAPISMVCILLGTLVQISRGHLPTRPGDTKRFFIMCGVGVFMALYALSNVGGYSSQSGIGGIANAAAYVPFIYLLPLHFRNYTASRDVFKAWMVIYILVALYALKQAWFGLAGWEIDYLKSGLTVEGRVLWEQEALRVFSTLNGASTLSVILSTLAVASLFFVRKEGAKYAMKPEEIARRVLTFILMAVAAYYTISRGGWVCGITALAGYFLFRKRIVAFAVYGITALLVLLMAVNARTLLDMQISTEIESAMMDGSEGDVGKRAMTMGTFNGRLESMLKLENPEIWTPFGLAIAGKPREYTHDVLTMIVTRFGYVPSSLLIIFSVIIIYRSHTKLDRVYDSEVKQFLLLVYALVFGILIGIVANPAQLTSYPNNVLIFFLIGLCMNLFSIDRLRKQRAIMLAREARAEA